MLNALCRTSELTLTEKIFQNVQGRGVQGRRGCSLNDSTGCDRALCEHLGVWYLAQGYLCSALNVAKSASYGMDTQETQVTCIAMRFTDQE